MSEEARSEQDHEATPAQQSVSKPGTTEGETTEPDPGPASPDTATPDPGSTSPGPGSTTTDTATSESAPPETAPAGTGPDADADAENTLSGFLDSLDERARKWWASRKERNQRAEQPADHTAGQPEQPEQPEQHQTGPVTLPKPPPAEHRPPGQLFTGSIPVLAPVPPAAELPAADSAADQVPTPAPGQLPRPYSPDPAADTDPARQEPSRTFDAGPEASAEDTVVLPAYRDDGDPRGHSSSTSARPRMRRSLDEQRQRDVIVQKAMAIEDETAAYGLPPGHEFADEEEDLYTYIPPYNLPSRGADPQPTRWDMARRVFVTFGALAALISAAWMFGWLTGEDSPAILSDNALQEAYADGWFSGEYALLSPDHNVYWLWPVIVVGLIVHAGFQWTSTQASTPRQRRSGWLVGAASMLMLGVTAALHQGLLTWMLISSILIAGLLLDAVRQFNLHTSRTALEHRLTDAIVGLFFGFGLVQAMSSVSVWLTAHGWEVPGFPALLWAAAGLFICVWTAAFYAMTERGRITIALGLGWGMFWLIFPRLLAEVTSVWVAIGAAMGAFIVILATQSRRHWINHAERRAAMGRPLEDII